MKRTYGQYCAVARGLDILGHRWILLIARDLLLGPKRYSDLLDGLSGIGTNLLATRLREMQQAGLIERAVLPPPASSSVYRLTNDGQALEPVIIAIGRWGGQFLDQPGPAEVMVPRAYFVAMRSSFRADLAGDLTASYEVRVDGLVFDVRVSERRCTTREGAATEPDAVLEMDVATLNALLLQRLPADEAVAAGRVRVTGDRTHVRRFTEMFAIRR